MRIIAGQWRGRRIVAPEGRDVRPTLDRVREAWMSIVGPLLPDARVLDLFAGSGALGLEALSRGAASADLVESATPSLRAIAENIATLNADEVARVHKGDALKYMNGLEAHAYDVAFADPPYEMGLSQQIAQRWLEVPFADVLGVEHRWFEKMPAGGELRRYGDSAITFYRVP
ncbi:MAG: methyltransferase [Gemmatimonadetes bacterium]|jgi:16S rRNA (guanine966-N2)-methyltransferase|nr:methyltransferase [Gemmatimonadota bacterium]